MTTITMLSAVEIIESARTGALTVRDIIEAHIQQIERVNPQINAVVTPLFESARAAAAEADAQRMRDEPLPALFGLPITIKDSLDVGGAPATCGMLARKDRIAERDAAVVALLRQAGAIVIGKTNTPEVCWAQETINLVYGRTNNPWNLEHTTGGSTGGEAAIIAAGGSPLGMGSDISGSIRMPAAFTGIVGLRPTSHTFDQTGHYPYPTGRLADLQEVGPMARRVEDVALAFKVLSGRDAADESALRGQKVMYWFNGGIGANAAPSIRQAVSDAVSALQDIGMQPVKRSVPLRVRFASVGWVSYIDQDARDAIDAAFMGKRRQEIANHKNGQPTVSGETLHYWTGTDVFSPIIERFFNGPHWRQRLYNDFLKWVGEGGVVVCPIHPTTAPRHNWQFSAPVTTISYQQWVNVAGLPGLTVPAGVDANGLPTAVQIVGARGREDVILAAGAAIQRALISRWKTPKMFQRI